MAGYADGSNNVNKNRRRKKLRLDKKCKRDKYEESSWRNKRRQP